jgi:GTP-binding protein EngB required for normal cell division
VTDSTKALVNSGTLELPDQSAVERLQQLHDIAAELGSDRMAAEAEGLAQRVAEGRFYVACVGQFKRGKSTLINALIGAPILPAGIVPVTAVPTVIRYGQATHVRVRLQQGTWKDVAVESLSDYVSEENNPSNTKKVVGVEVFHPSPLLVEGMCLIDTPGLGSVFESNTESTRELVPHIDAAIVVIGADPPITGEELSLVKEVAKQVNEIVIVLNKADRVSAEERSAAGEFARKMLRSSLNRDLQVYELSALQALLHGKDGWNSEELIWHLKQLVEESGATLVSAAYRRGLARISDELLAIVAAEHDALLQPIEESEKRIGRMRQTLAESGRSLRDLGYLLTSEQHRLSDLFLSQRKKYMEEALPAAEQEYETEVAKIERTWGPAYRRSVMYLAQDIARRRVTPWLSLEQQRAESAYREAMVRFTNYANEFLSKLASEGIRELALLPSALDPERGFRKRSEFSFYDYIQLARPASPLLFLGDLLLGAAGQYGRFQRRGKEFLDLLMETNSTRVQSDLQNRVQESRQQLEVEIRKLLFEVGRIAERALDRARAARNAGEAQVATALETLATLKQEIETLRNSAVSGPGHQ